MKDKTFQVKWWYVWLSAFFYFTIMIKSYRILTYAYCYLLPMLFFFFNTNWCVKKIYLLFSKELIFIPICFILMCTGTVLMTFIQGTQDYNYFINGPLVAIIKRLILNMFLLLIYEKKVSKSPHPVEYMQYFVYAVSAYILTTIFICLIPSLHNFIIDNIYLTPFQHDKIQEASYYTRIGWSGFSGFGHTLYCTIALICNSVVIFYNRKNKRKFWSAHFFSAVLVVGNMCYGRSGLVISIICLMIQFVVLFLEKERDVLAYPLMALCAGGTIVLLQSYSLKIKAWYDWCFSVVNSFLSTGQLSTGSLNSMYDMYFLPPFETVLVGDSRYVEGSGYYMNTDIGWLRPILNYGAFFTMLGYLSAGKLILALKRRLLFLKKKEYIGITAMWFISLILFELKGEVFYELVAFILPVCLMQNNNKVR